MSAYANISGMGLPLKQAIRHFREQLGATQQQCADAAGMGQARDWSNLERQRGTTNVSPRQLRVVAGVLEVTASELERKADELGAP